jgi:hypothetical protein
VLQAASQAAAFVAECESQSHLPHA